MRGKVEEREKARELRREGLSINAIVRELGVAKSSVSVWVRDIELTPEQHSSLRSRTSTGRPRGKRRQSKPKPVDDGRVRWCKRCEQVLPMDAFNRNKDGHQHWCRECFREYFRERGDLHRKQSGDARSARREPLRWYVLEHLLQNPCVVCGEDDPIVLEFDHVRGTKESNICDIVGEGRPLGELLEEIAKCEVVCVSCHRMRTATRAGSYVAEGRRSSSWRRTTVARRMAMAVRMEHLLEHPCIDCGDARPSVLDFDHIGGKEEDVAVLVARGETVARIREEMARCVIRCANCHRLRTALERGTWRALNGCRSTAGEGRTLARGVKSSLLYH